MDQQQALEQLVASSRKQERYARIQCVCAVAAALFCLLLLISVCRVIPEIQQLAAQVNNLSSQAETVLNNLETVSDALVQADIPGMVDNVSTLVDSSQEGVQQALEKVNAIDIDTLNKAIENLTTIVTPLANIVNKLQSLPF